MHFCQSIHGEVKRIISREPARFSRCPLNLQQYLYDGVEGGERGNDDEVVDAALEVELLPEAVHRDRHRVVAFSLVTQVVRLFARNLSIDR